MPGKYEIRQGRVMVEKAPVVEIEPGYDFEEARNHLLGRFTEVAAWVRGLPEGASPDDYLVIKVVLHPDRLAQANFPRHFLRYLKLSILGSHEFKTRLKKSFDSAGEQANGPLGGVDGQFPPIARRRTISLYVAGCKEDMAAVAQKFRDIRPDSPAARQMACL